MFLRCVLMILVGLLMSGCGRQEPIRIGFIGGLSDRNSDVGQAGHSGVILAIEQANRAGGIHGRRIELIARDDAQDRETSVRSARELAEARVEAVIGPFTSGVAAAVVPTLAYHGILALSPTLTSMDFFGRDDNLIRINRSTRDNAGDYAKVLYGRGQRRIAIAFDVRNRSFTESWLIEFRRAFVARGGRLVAEVPYESAADADFDGVVRTMLAARPDGLFFISGALDVARLAQQARRLAPALPLGASEWAATEQLIELGGQMVEGLVIVQNYDRDDESVRFRQFREAFYKRFQKSPGYSAVSAYDAATVLLEALARRKHGERVKDAVLRQGPYQGLQQQIAFDANGDTPRQVFFTEIRDGRFVRIR